MARAATCLKAPSRAKRQKKTAGSPTKTRAKRRNASASASRNSAADSSDSDQGIGPSTPRDAARRDTTTRGDAKRRSGSMILISDEESGRGAEDEAESDADQERRIGGGGLSGPTPKGAEKKQKGKSWDEMTPQERYKAAPPGSIRLLRYPDDSEAPNYYPGCRPCMHPCRTCLNTTGRSVMEVCCMAPNGSRDACAKCQAMRSSGCDVS